MKHDIAEKVVLNELSPFGVEIANTSHRPLDLAGASPFYIKSLLEVYKLVVLRGFRSPAKPALTDHAKHLVAGHDELLSWDFGELMELKVNQDAENYLFSEEPVPLHWDGAFHKVPSYLFFHCVKAPLADQGGRTVFVDTTKIWQQASEEQQTAWRDLELEFETEKKAHYGGRISSPLVQDHPGLGVPVLRFAEEVATELNPVSLRIHGSKNGSDIYEDLRKRMYNDQNVLRHEWRDGDILLADNHALVHGREAIKPKTERLIRRVQLL